MRKGIGSRLILLAVLLTGSFGAAVMGDAWRSEAYYYGISEINETDYPLSMQEGLKLCYTFSGDTAVYVDETSAYALSKSGDMYYFVANAILWEKERTTAPARQERVVSRTETFAYDVAAHRMYRRVNGKFYILPERVNMNARDDVKISMALGMQIWHAVKKSNW